jgi:hypothetical protein
MKCFVRRVLIVMAAILGIVLAQVAPASATTAKNLENNLATLWTAVLETPSPQNPFGSGGAAFACINIGHDTLAPFAGGPELSCTATPDTKIFVVGYSWECSSFTGDHTSNTGDNFVYGTNAGQLRQCARNNDLQEAPTAIVDGKSVTVTEVETSPLSIVLPADNIFSEPAGKEGKSVAHGWVTLLNPLTVGEHKIVIADPIHGTTVTTIVVTSSP